MCQFLDCVCQLMCIFFLCKFLCVKREKLAKLYTAPLMFTLGLFLGVQKSQTKIGAPSLDKTIQ